MASIISATTTNGLSTSADNSGSLQLATNNGTTAVTIDSSQQVGIGTTTPSATLHVNGTGNQYSRLSSSTHSNFIQAGCVSGNTFHEYKSVYRLVDTDAGERMRIDTSGVLLIGATSTNSLGSTAGIQAYGLGYLYATVTNDAPGGFARRSSDGDLVLFRRDTSTEGTISVSGSTVSYNGGHLSRWSQLPDCSKDNSILKGTVMSNLDDMCVWEKDGVVANNEQLNKMKVSDVEGDTNVAGVFVNWTVDSNYGVDDMNIAMTGDMIIRIADGVVVQKGDLLMSAGDGTAKPQGDDIVRSKTIAKVTSNHVTCTYADGSYCVPCVLMAC